MVCSVHSTIAYNPALVSLLARYLTGNLYLFLTWAFNQSTHINQIIELEGCTQKGRFRESEKPLHPKLRVVEVGKTG